MYICGHLSFFWVAGLEPASGRPRSPTGGSEVRGGGGVEEQGPGGGKLGDPPPPLLQKQWNITDWWCGGSAAGGWRSLKRHYTFPSLSLFIPHLSSFPLSIPQHFTLYFQSFHSPAFQFPFLSFPRLRISNEMWTHETLRNDKLVSANQAGWGSEGGGGVGG